MWRVSKSESFFTITGETCASFFNRRRHWLNAIVAIAFTLIVDALFTYALGTPMAEGWLAI